MNALDQYPAPRTDGISGQCALLVLEAQEDPSKLSSVAQQIIEKYAYECLRLERKLALCREALSNIRRCARIAEADWNDKPSIRALVLGDLVAIARTCDDAISATQQNQ